MGWGQQQLLLLWFKNVVMLGSTPDLDFLENGYPHRTLSSFAPFVG